MTMTSSTTQPDILRNSDLDYDKLTRQLDRVKAGVFLGKSAAFLGSLMCTLNFSWTSDIQTACTNGIRLCWNPYWFQKLPEETRKTVLVHELWHVGLLHMVRSIGKDQEVFNYAADIFINNMLEDDGFSFKGTRPWKDQKYRGWAVEDIYDDLMRIKNDLAAIYGGVTWGHENINGEGDSGDLTVPEDENEPPDMLTEDAMAAAIINKVVQAQTAAGLSGGGAGDLPGEIQTILKRFLNPKLPWEQLFYKFFTELGGEDYQWTIRDRRFEDIYLPSIQDDHNGLEHVVYFLDVSGSVSDAEVIRFNSEVKYIKEIFNPKLLTLIQFDTIIQDIKVFTEDDPFEELVVVGRGGTDLRCVREKIDEIKPTAVVVFSDLQCAVMDVPEHQTPIIWIAVNNTGATVNSGELHHIRE